MEHKILLSSKSKAYVQLIITAFGWALNTILIKIYVVNIPTFHLLLGRFFVGSLFILLYNPKRFVAVQKEDIKSGSLLGILLFATYSLAISSLIYTSASKSGFLISLPVLFVPIVETALRKIWPSKWTAISVICSIIGLRLIGGINGSGFNLGDLLAVLGAIVYTVYILALDRLGKDKDDLILTEVQIIVVTIVSAFAALFFEGLNFRVILTNILVMLVMGIMGTGITTLFQAKAQKVVSPESVGILLLAEPLFTLIMAYFILHETILISGLLGSALLLFSLVVAVIKKV